MISFLKTCVCLIRTLPKVLLKPYLIKHVFLLILAVYAIYYGNWPATPKSIVQNFLVNIGVTPWWAINKGYGVNNLVYKSSINDNYSQGTVLTLGSIWNVVTRALNLNLLPKDPNGVYLVLSSRFIYYFDSPNQITTLFARLIQNSYI